MARAKKGVVWNRDGFKALRNEPSVQDHLNALAWQVGKAAARQGNSTESVKVFENGSAQDDNNGYQITPLVLEDPRNATSVMAVGEGHYHNRKYSALLRGLSEVARGK